MKKGLTLLLAVAMLFVMATPAAAASFTDTEGKNCETAVSVLSALGIVEGKAEGLYEPDSALTRAEMVTIILRAMNLASNAVGQDIFEDVKSDHWAYANVTAAYITKIVNGIDETHFSPDTPVTYQQAVKMVVAALGYEVQADAMGGYPAGYLAKAAQLDILKGAPAPADGSMTRGMMAMILYNALDVELLQQTGYGADAYSYGTDKDATLLSYYLHTKLITSRIVATATAQFETPSRTLLEDEVLLADASILRVGETDALSNVGVKGDFYVREDDDGDEVIVAFVPASGTEILTVNAKDISSSTTASSFVYEDETGKELKIALSGATLCYNGRVKTPWTASDIQPEIGSVRLIASSASSYDYIVVESYVNYVVDSKDSENNALYFMEEVNGIKDMVIETTDRKNPTSFVDTEGLPIEVLDCAKWDIVSIAASAASADGSVKKIIRSLDSVAGEITEYSDDEVVIDGTTYTVSPSLLASTLSKPALGQSATYYLDFTGCIAAVDTSHDAALKYGWMVGAAMTKGLGAKPQFKIFTGDAEMKVFDTTEKVNFNGVTTASENLLVPSVDNPLCAAGVVKSQLLRYKTNEDGTLLTQIETATNVTTKATEEEKIDLPYFNWAYQIDGSKRLVSVDDSGSATVLQSNITYVGSTVGTFTTRLMPRDKTKIFIVPPGGSSAKDADYAIKPYNSLTHGNDGETYTNMSFFDVGEDLVVGAMVWDQSAALTATKTYPTYSSNVALITDVVQGINEDGEALYIAKAYTAAGKEITMSAEPDFECLYKMANSDFDNDPDWYTSIAGDGTKTRDTVRANANRCEMQMEFKDLDPGDVVQYTVEASGEASMINVLYRAMTPGNVEMAGANRPTLYVNYMGGMMNACATVESASTYGFAVKANLADKSGRPTGVSTLRAYPASGRLVLWNAEKKTMKTITATDVVRGDKVVAFWRTNTQMMLIVYR